MANKVFKGFRQVDGTAQGFSTDSFENGYVYFVRTDVNGDGGYIWFNGKKYGEDERYIDCGEY